MPHTLIEHDATLDASLLHSFLEELHPLLKKNLPTDLRACKSRLIPYSSYRVGDSATTPFLHLTLKIMKGRSADTLKNVGQEILKLAISIFHKDSPSLSPQISLEIVELSEHYFKDS